MIVCLTLNYDLDLEVTLVKHVLCRLLHGTVHFAKPFQNVTNPLRVIERKHKKVVES